jgi:hypothetical protein
MDFTENLYKQFFATFTLFLWDTEWFDDVSEAMQIEYPDHTALIMNRRFDIFGET